MENFRTPLIIALFAISAVLYVKWIEFSDSKNLANNSANVDSSQIRDVAVPEISSQAEAIQVPSETPNADLLEVPGQEALALSDPASLITIETDLAIVTINTKGAVIERMELKEEPLSTDKLDQGFPLLKKTASELFNVEDGLFNAEKNTPNHQTQYSAAQKNYVLGDLEQVQVPLSWKADNGVFYTKVMTFKRDSYVVDIDYQISNGSNTPWNGFLYAQFLRTKPTDSGGGFGQLPSYTGGATYTEEDKYNKVDFGDIKSSNLDVTTNNGWVAMLQHYFVGVWIPQTGPKKFYSTYSDQANPRYRIGYRTEQATQIAAGQTGTIGTQVFLGPKEQSRLKKIQKEKNIKGLPLTVDYGFLTFIADPLFTVLSWIHAVVGNWGWAIILLTLLIKILFYPLSAASYKSMAGMKKLQPRLKTLQERHKGDRQKLQMEMMALYKKEKVNPAGGCLPILIQIPVFIALYWALLESVELRQAPFALWWQDLSAPDPFYVLPVLMGASMWLQQKLNPAPMDEIQKKVMTIMPIALTFLFLTFPAGLVLYWVTNNVLSMAQQWYINRKFA